MKFTKIAAFTFLLALGAAACSSDSTSGGTEPTETETTDTPASNEAAVAVEDSTFDPAEVTVAVGGTVTWTWEGTELPHNVVSSDDPELNSGDPTAEPGTEYSFTFEEAGTFEYMCAVHGESMSGTVTVA